MFDLLVSPFFDSQGDQIKVRFGGTLRVRPTAKETQRQVIEVLAQNVLDARDLYPELTLADLYDPDKMPRELKDAHEHLDRAVDQLYRAKAFENDEERLQMLFEKYEKLVASAKEETAKKGKSK